MRKQLIACAPLPRKRVEKIPFLGGNNGIYSVLLCRAWADFMFLGDEVGDLSVIDEVWFIIDGCVPLRGLACSDQVVHTVKPQFRHAVEIGVPDNSGNADGVTLHKLSESGNLSADRTEHVLPIVKELIVGNFRLFL